MIAWQLQIEIISSINDVFLHFQCVWDHESKGVAVSQEHFSKGCSTNFSNKSYFLRTLWTISSICFISTAVYQSCLLTREYFEYPTVFSINERNLDLIGATHKAVRLPDVTLCNMNPFAIDTRNITGVSSLESYYWQVRELTDCTSCSQEEQQLSWELRQALQTTSG